MATTHNFGQIPDIRFTSLCCRGRLILDRNCNLNVATGDFESVTIRVGGKLEIPGVNVNATDSCIDFTGATIRAFDMDVTGNFNGIILGNLIDENIESVHIEDIIGNILGDILGDISGDINGSINVTELDANVIQSNIFLGEFIDTNVLRANAIQGNVCIPAGNSLVFKPQSEMRGDICIPANTIVNFKMGSNVIIDTAFGTQNDGDILVHDDDVTTVLPLGGNRTVLFSDGDQLMWTSNITVENVKANSAIIGDFIGNIALGDINMFANLIVQDIQVANAITVPILNVGKIGSDENPAELCGNVIGDQMLVDALWDINGDLVICGNLEQQLLQATTQVKDLIVCGNITFIPIGIQSWMINQEVGNLVINNADLVFCLDPQTQINRKIFQDDFNRANGSLNGDGWTVLEAPGGGNTYEIDSQKARINTAVITAGHEGQLFAGSPEFQLPILSTNGVLEISFEIRWISPLVPGPPFFVGQHAGLLFFWQDPTRGRFGTIPGQGIRGGYSIEYTQNTNLLNFVKWDNASFTIVQSISAAGVPLEWRLVVQSGQMDWYGDDVLLMTVIDSTYRGGYSAFWVYEGENQDVEFDNFCINVFQPDYGIITDRYETKTGDKIISVNTQDNVVTFEDNFNRPDEDPVTGWIPLQSNVVAEAISTYAVVNNQLSIIPSGINPGEGNDNFQLFAGDPEISLPLIDEDENNKLVISFEIEWTSPSGLNPTLGRVGGVLFYWQNPNIPRQPFSTDRAGYEVLYVEGGLGWGLFKFESGTGSEILLSNIPTVDLPDPPQRWRIEIIGELINVYGDGIFYLSAIDNTYRSGFAAILVFEDEDNQVIVDNFKIELVNRQVCVTAKKGLIINEKLDLSNESSSSSSGCIIGNTLGNITIVNNNPKINDDLAVCGNLVLGNLFQFQNRLLSPVINGDFETGDLTGWTSTTNRQTWDVTNDPSEVYAGTFSARCRSGLESLTLPSNGYIEQIIPIGSEVTYTVSVLQKTINPDVINPNLAFLSFIYMDIRDLNASMAVLGGIFGGQQTETIITTTAWTKRTITATTEAGTAFLRVRFIQNISPQSFVPPGFTDIHQSFWDDFQLTVFPGPCDPPYNKIYAPGNNTWCFSNVTIENGTLTTKLFDVTDGIIELGKGCIIFDQLTGGTGQICGNNRAVEIQNTDVIVNETLMQVVGNVFAENLIYKNGITSARYFVTSSNDFQQYWQGPLDAGVELINPLINGFTTDQAYDPFAESWRIHSSKKSLYRISAEGTVMINFTSSGIFRIDFIIQGGWPIGGGGSTPINNPELSIKVIHIFKRVDFFPQTLPISASIECLSELDPNDNLEQGIAFFYDVHSNPSAQIESAVTSIAIHEIL